MLNYKVVLTGGSGFLGGYVYDSLIDNGFRPERIFVPRRRSYDLTNSSETRKMYEDFRPDLVVHLAAEVGGIEANRKNPGRFFFSNLSMGLNLIEQGRVFGIKKFVHVGTVCSYPKHCPIPFSEESIWDGYPEETNAPYGISKKAIMVMLEAYRDQYGMDSSILIPCNLYGPRDNFDPDSGHVIPGMIRRFEEASNKNASQVVCWGTGSATREFLHAKDAASAIVKSIFVNENRPMNLGGGLEISIRNLSEIIAELCGYKGKIVWDSSRPDGQPRRLLNCSRARDSLKWSPSIDIRSGLKETIEWWKSV